MDTLHITYYIYSHHYYVCSLYHILCSWEGKKWKKKSVPNHPLLQVLRCRYHLAPLLFGVADFLHWLINTYLIYTYYILQTISYNHQPTNNKLHTLYTIHNTQYIHKTITFFLPYFSCLGKWYDMIQNDSFHLGLKARNFFSMYFSVQYGKKSFIFVFQSTLKTHSCSFIHNRRRI